MDRVRALLADLQSWLAAASPRERRLLAMAAGGVLLFVVLVTWASFSRATSGGRAALEKKREALKKTSRLSAGYNAQERERQLMEARLRQSPPALMSFV